MKDALLDTLERFKNNGIVEWEDEGLQYIISIVEYLENDIPGKRNGDLRWKLLWDWIVVETTGEVLYYKQEVKELVRRIICEMNGADGKLAGDYLVAKR